LFVWVWLEGVEKGGGLQTQRGMVASRTAGSAGTVAVHETTYVKKNIPENKPQKCANERIQELAGQVTRRKVPEYKQVKASMRA